MASRYINPNDSYKQHSAATIVGFSVIIRWTINYYYFKILV